jgi:hypothetical protein
MTKIKKTTKYIVELPSSLDDIIKHNADFVMSDVERARQELKANQQKLNGALQVDNDLTLDDAKRQLAQTLAGIIIPDDTLQIDGVAEELKKIKMNSVPLRTKAEAKARLRRTQRVLSKKVPR